MSRSMTFRIPADLAAALDEKAEASGLTKTEIVCEGIYRLVGESQEQRRQKAVEAIERAHREGRDVGSLV